MWVVPRHSRISRVPGFTDTGCVGFAAAPSADAPSNCASLRNIALERPPSALSCIV